MSNTRNLADLLDTSGDIKSAALDNVDVSGKLNTSGGTLTGTLTMESTDAGNSAAPELILYRNSASPASGDYLGQVQFKGENANGAQEIYAKVTGKISDPTHTSEDGLIETAIKGDGSFTIVSRQKADELQLLNGVNLDVDGSVTATGYTGSGANLTSLPAAQLTGALPAISGAALTGLVPTTLTASNNIGLGTNAVDSITTGDDNVGVGTSSLSGVTTGSNNTAIGVNSLYSNSSGSYNTAFGHSALRQNNTGTHNTAVGLDALYNNTTGTRNVAVGLNALVNSTTADDNTAVGYSVMGANTTGSNNVAVGTDTFLDNTTGSGNTALGRRAMYNNTTANYNTSIGYNSLYYNTTGDQNVAVGQSALQNNSTGFQNTAVGNHSLESNTTGDRNVAVGETALDANTTGIRNVAIGRAALSSTQTASYNVGVGHSVMGDTTTGHSNTGMGYAALNDLLTGDRNIGIGYNTQVSATGANDQIVMGAEVVGYANNTFTFGSGSTDTTITFGNTTWSAPSDQRLKEEITTSTAGLGFINDLRPVTFKWKKEKDIPTDLAGYVEGSENRYKTNTTEHGFIAQEVKTAINAHSEIKDGFDMWSEGSDGRQRIADSALVPILVKAVQELSAKNEALLTRIEALEG